MPAIAKGYYEIISGMFHVEHRTNSLGFTRRFFKIVPRGTMFSIKPRLKAGSGLPLLSFLSFFQEPYRRIRTSEGAHGS